MGNTPALLTYGFAQTASVVRLLRRAEGALIGAGRRYRAGSPQLLVDLSENVVGSWRIPRQKLPYVRRSRFREPKGGSRDRPVGGAKFNRATNAIGLRQDWKRGDV